jgi:high affinity choline transporter 7
MHEYVQRFGDRARLFPRVTDWYGADPWAWRWLDSALLLSLGGIPWQVYFQRILACRTTGVAIGMSMLASLICLAVAVLPAMLGAIGACIDWTAYPSGPPADASEVLPHVLRFALPPVVSLIGLVVIVAAVMSSMDSSILASASLFAWNVYRPLYGLHELDGRIPRVLRIAIVAVGAMAIWLTFQVESVYQLWYLSSDLVYVILFPQLVTGLFFHGTRPAGAVAGLVVAVVFRAAIFAASTSAGSQWLAAAQLPAIWSYLPWLTFAMLSSLLAIVVVSWIATARASAATTRDDDGVSITE